MHLKSHNKQAYQLKPQLSQSGFTLVELMLAMTLGLILSAAAFQLFTNSISTQRLQQSMSEVQDAAVFGFGEINKEIAHANLGSSRAMKQQSAWTGIVFTGSEDSAQLNTEGKTLKIGNLRGLRGIEATLLTKSNAGPSNLISPLKSDQLTIQYRAPYDSYDCEGRRVSSGDMIVERYFTRTDNQRVKNETKALAIVLACDAGSYQLLDDLSANNITDERMVLKNFGDKGAVLINRVDYFSVKLGVKLKEGMAYMPIESYLTKQAESFVYDAPVISIQIGIIGRGNSSIGLASPTLAASTFRLHGSDFQIREKTPNYIRRSLQTVVTLRNSRGR